MKHPKPREPFIYSEEFRAAVLSAFPGSERIRRMLEEDSFFLGQSFSEGGIPAITPALIIALLESGRAETLLRVARDAEQKRQLYEMWKTEVYEG
ncbi:hypothetical protein [Methanosarcina sp. UBA289]|uniref:hypothetical protein n=1 Tax=Methanosarcina sp. UBA289 TaxID=1915574 RepID=UPI0025FC9A54|nr:hypothetical protein [Methanosarcina sp. UBA289]